MASKNSPENGHLDARQHRCMIISLISWARIKRIIIYQELEKEKREYLNIQIFVNQFFPEKIMKMKKAIILLMSAFFIIYMYLLQVQFVPVINLK